MVAIASGKALTVPNKRGRPKKDRPDPQVNVGFRCAKGLANRIEDAAKVLGTDFSGLVRMILLEHLAEYEARAAKIRDSAP